MDTRRLNDAELEAIEKRLEASSKGPWHAEDDQVLTGKDVLCDVCCGEIEQAVADAVFLAHTREDVERLLVEVRSLKQELQKSRLK
jgi:hypothetical protein